MHMTEMFWTCPEKSWGNHREFSLIVHLEFKLVLTKAVSGWLAVYMALDQILNPQHLSKGN